MKIVNQTRYKTEHLRAFVRRVADIELDPAKRKRIVVKFRPARQQRGVTGHAYIHGRHSQINIPTKVIPDKADLACTIAHELAHNRGSDGERWMRAKDCRYSSRGDAYKRIWAWAYDMPLEFKEPKEPKPKPTPAAIVDGQLSRLESRIKTWTVKEKRAKTALKKYRRKLAYYQKRKAAMGPT